MNKNMKIIITLILASCILLGVIIKFANCFTIDESTDPIFLIDLNEDSLILYFFSKR